MKSFGEDREGGHVCRISLWLDTISSQCFDCLCKRSNVNKLTEGLAVPDNLCQCRETDFKGRVHRTWMEGTDDFTKEAGNGNAAQEMPSRWSDGWDTSFKVTRQLTN